VDPGVLVTARLICYNHPSVTSASAFFSAHLPLFNLNKAEISAVLKITPQVSISEQELSFTFDRSPGPGGQKTNKTSTRVTLHFDVDQSPSLTSKQKQLVRQRLATRINSEGILKISSSKERTQLANRRATVNRFVELMSKAVVPPRRRRKTRPPKSADRKRLEEKKKRGKLKQTRSSGVSMEE
jgi:ribosome-associated protein